MSRVITVRCSDVLHAKFKGRCELDHVSVNRALITLMQEHLEREGKDEPAPDDLSR